MNQPIETLTRRALFQRAGAGIGAVALTQLLGDERTAPHFAPRARNVIYIHLIGAPSHLDLFDFKPELQKREGEKCPDEFFAGKRLAFIRNHPRLLGGLLALGADPNARSGADGSTALVQAADRSLAGLAATLLEAGADVHGGDRNGRTALDADPLGLSRKKGRRRRTASRTRSSLGTQPRLSSSSPRKRRLTRRRRSATLPASVRSAAMFTTTRMGPQPFWRAERTLCT